VISATGAIDSVKKVSEKSNARSTTSNRRNWQGVESSEGERERVCRSVGDGEENQRTVNES
jgi:hypothetical protein